MDRRQKMLFKAACIDFIVLGLLTILFYLYQFPLIFIVSCFILCCLGLLFEVTNALYLVSCSLTRKTSRRIDERTPLLTSSDLEAQSIRDGNEDTYQNPRRSSPLPIPRREPVEQVAGFIPRSTSRPWLTSQPWMSSSLVSWYLEWRRKHVAPKRRYTLSEIIVTNQFNNQPRTLRNHTLSESAVQEFERVTIEETG